MKTQENPAEVSMSTEYKIRFIESVERTPSSTSYRFERPQELSFVAGQYMLVALDKDLAHPLSISNSPEDHQFLEFTKRLTDSAYSRRLKSLKAGDMISVKGPSGSFCVNNSFSSLVFIAGGIGITPIRSILISLQGHNVSPGTITLFYGNMNREDIAFREELENIHLPQYRIIHVLADPSDVENAYQGFITTDIVKKELGDAAATSSFMISGPPGMVEAMKDALVPLNVPEGNIITDLFVGYE